MDRVFSVDDISHHFWSPPPPTTTDHHDHINRSSSEWCFQRFLLEASATSPDHHPSPPPQTTATSASHHPTPPPDIGATSAAHHPSLPPQNGSTSADRLSGPTPQHDATSAYSRHPPQTAATSADPQPLNTSTSADHRRSVPPKHNTATLADHNYHADDSKTVVNVKQTTSFKGNDNILVDAEEYQEFLRNKLAMACKAVANTRVYSPSQNDSHINYQN